MEKVFDATDFEGRLNLDGFTNIEKGFTSKEFATKYPSEDFLVFEKSQIENYKQNVLRAVQEDQLQKGGNPFTSEKEDILEKAKQELGQLHKVRINDGPGLVREVYVMEKARKWNIGDTREMNGKKYVLKPAKSGTGRLSWIVVKDGEKESSKPKSSEDDQKISLIEKLIKQGFSPEEAKEKVEGKKVDEKAKKTTIKEGDSVSYQKTKGADNKIPFKGEVVSIDKDGKYAQVRNSIGDIDYVPTSDLKKESKQKKQEENLGDRIEKILEVDPNLTDKQIAKQLNISEKELKEYFGILKKKTLGNTDLEKGVLDSFRYGQSKIDFKKKGSDIKTKLVIKQQELLNCIEKEQEHIAELEKDFIRLPTQNPDLWGERKVLKVNYKVFAWNQTYFAPEDAQTPMSIIGNNGEDCQACESKEEAEMNSKYNSCVYKIIDCMMDLRLIDLYLDSFEDNKNYTLTTEQMLELGF